MKSLTLRKVPILVCFFIAAQCVFSQPKLKVIGGTRLDFGKIHTDRPYKHEVVITNDGSDTLIISEVSSSCGCTAALMSNDHIAPHDSGALGITFDAKRFNGKVAKSVSFKTNDPSQSNVHINFSAQINRILEVTPEYLIFSHVKVDSPATEQLIISNDTDQRVHITSVKTSSDVLSVKLSKNTIIEGTEAVLTCTLQTSKPGTYNGNIEIRTDNPDMPVLNIRFFGLVSNKNTLSSSKQN